MASGSRSTAGSRCEMFEDGSATLEGSVRGTKYDPRVVRRRVMPLELSELNGLKRPVL